MLQVSIITEDSQSHSFSVPEESTVQEFKEQISSELNIAVDKQRLIFCGKVLRDKKKLKEYGVNGKVIHVVQKFYPQRSRATSSSCGSSNATTSGPRVLHRDTAGFVSGALTIPDNFQDPTQAQVDVVIYGEESNQIQEANGEESNQILEANGEESNQILEANGEESNQILEANGEEFNQILEANSLKVNGIIDVNANIDENIEESDEVKLVDVVIYGEEFNQIQEAYGEEFNQIQEANGEECNQIQEANGEECNQIQEANGEEFNQILEANGEESNQILEANGEESNEIQEANSLKVNGIIDEQEENSDLYKKSSTENHLIPYFDGQRPENIDSFVDETTGRIRTVVEKMNGNSSVAGPSGHSSQEINRRQGIQPFFGQINISDEGNSRSLTDKTGSMNSAQPSNESNQSVTDHAEENFLDNAAVYEPTEKCYESGSDDDDIITKPYKKRVPLLEDESSNETPGLKKDNKPELVILSSSDDDDDDDDDDCIMCSPDNEAIPSFKPPESSGYLQSQPVCDAVTSSNYAIEETEENVNIFRPLEAATNLDLDLLPLTQDEISCIFPSQDLQDICSGIFKDQVTTEEEITCSGQDFIDDQAEVSGDDTGSDNEPDGESDKEFVNDTMEVCDEEENAKKLAELHMKQQRDHDEEVLRFVKQKFLQHGDLESKKKRTKKFTWHHDKQYDKVDEKKSSSEEETDSEDNTINEKFIKKADDVGEVEVLSPIKKKKVKIVNGQTKVRRNCAKMVIRCLKMMKYTSEETAEICIDKKSVFYNNPSVSKKMKSDDTSSCNQPSTSSKLTKAEEKSSKKKGGKSVLLGTPSVNKKVVSDAKSCSQPSTSSELTVAEQKLSKEIWGKSVLLGSPSGNKNVKSRGKPPFLHPPTSSLLTVAEQKLSKEGKSVLLGSPSGNKNVKSRGKPPFLHPPTSSLLTVAEQKLSKETKSTEIIQSAGKNLNDGVESSCEKPSKLPENSKKVALKRKSISLDSTTGNKKAKFDATSPCKQPSTSSQLTVAEQKLSKGIWTRSAESSIRAKEKINAPKKVSPFLYWGKPAIKDVDLVKPNNEKVPKKKVTKRNKKIEKKDDDDKKDDDVNSE